MWSITVYSFENAAGIEQSFRTQDAEEAREYAREKGFRADRNVYEFVDSETVCDFTAQVVEA